MTGASKSKSIDAAQAERLAHEFADSVGRSHDDPIVRDLLNGVKRALGHRRWLNKQQAVKDALQPDLFRKRARMLEIPKSAHVDAHSSALEATAEKP